MICLVFKSIYVHSWVEPDLHEKRGGCHPYTQFCSTAKFLHSNQIAAFQVACSHLIASVFHVHITATLIASAIAFTAELLSSSV